MCPKNGCLVSVAESFGSSAGALLGYAFSSLILGVLSHHSGMRMIDQLTASVRAFPLNATVLACGVLTVAVSLFAVRGAAGCFGAGLALLMLAIAVFDRQRYVIPDQLNAAALALGVTDSILAGEGSIGAAIADVILRAAVLALLFFLLRLLYAQLRGRQGLGLGDVKLAAVAGSWLGWSVMPIAVEVAAMSALSAYAWRCYVLGRPLRSAGRLPFGQFFAPAIWIGWILQASILR